MRNRASGSVQPEHTNEPCGLVATAIVGGALRASVMGLFADYSSVQASFLVPMAAIQHVSWIALSNRRSKE
jgi:fucose permease